MQQFKKSFYGQHFPITIEKYNENQYSRFAVIFPGQGTLNIKDHTSQLKKIIQLKKYIQTIDDFLVNKLESKTLWYLTDPTKIKNNEFSIIQNLFLFSLNVAYFDYLVTHKKPEIITSHSFGEYSAFVCSGAISFEQMLEIVYQREILTPAIGELGTLVAAQIEIGQGQIIAAQLGIEVANVNSDQQLVFAVSIDRVKEVTSFFKKIKVANRILDQVGRPYHSSLMQSVALLLKNEIAKIDFELAPLKFQMISSVTGRYYPVGYFFEEQELVDIMSSQLTTPLNFPKIIRQICKQHIYSFIDLSHSGVYQQFISDIFRNEQTFISNQTLSQMYFIDQNTKTDQLFHLDLENNPLFKTLSKYIAQVTGYELVEIGVNDYFQEDLRIDSIKKAEIVFKTLQETNLNIEESLTLAQLRRVGDVVKYLEQRKENPTQNKYNLQYNPSDFYTWNLSHRSIQVLMKPLSNQSTIDQIILALNSDNHYLVERLNDFWLRNPGFKKQLIIDLSNFKYLIDYENELSLLLKWCELIQNYFPDSNQQNRHIVLTCYSVNPNLLDLPFSQFFRAVAIEHGFRFQWIQDIDQVLNFEDISNIIEDELHEHIQYRGGQVYANDFQICDLAIGIKSDFQAEKPHVLAIGGANGLCFELLLRQNAISITQLTIIGRTAKDDLHLAKQIHLLAKKYSIVQYIQCDCIDIQKLKSIREIINQKPIDLIINAAGVEKSEKLINKTSHQIKSEFLTKIAVSENLMNEYKAVPIIHFSSIVGLFGNEGQSVYSFANAWQAGISQRHQEAVSKVIFWPAIDQIGMTKNPGLYQKMKSSGVQFLNVEQATHFFENFVLDFLINENRQPLCIAHLKDLALMRFQLMDSTKWAKVWGQIVDPERMIFQHRFSIEEFNFIADHRFESMSVLPASLVVSQLISYGVKYLSDQIKINQLNINNMLMILPGKETLAHSQYHHHLVEKQQIIDFRMFSQLEHFTAQIVNLEISSKQSIEFSLPKLMFQEQQMSVDLSSFYSPECIDFGFKFQVFDELIFCQKNSINQAMAIGKIKKTNIYYQGEQFSDRLLMVIEACFQTASMFGVVVGKRLGIPLSIREIKLHEYNLQNVYCIAYASKSINQIQDEPMIFYIHVIDENNRLILEINDLVLSPIRSHPSLPFHWLEKQNTHEL